MLWLFLSPLPWSFFPSVIREKASKLATRLPGVSLHVYETVKNTVCRCMHGLSVF